MLEYKEIYNYEQYKGAHKLQKENSRDEQGARKDRTSNWFTADPRCYRCATLINRKSTMVQASGSEHENPGDSESCPKSGKKSVMWRAGTSTRVLINLSQRICIENCVVSTKTQ